MRGNKKLYKKILVFTALGFLIVFLSACNSNIEDNKSTPPNVPVADIQEDNNEVYNEESKSIIEDEQESEETKRENVEVDVEANAEIDVEANVEADVEVNTEDEGTQDSQSDTERTTPIESDNTNTPKPFNEIGNGNEIVTGPSGPKGGDIDNPFRSLTVHPKDSNIILIGTERNGFVKSTDGGENWERLRYGLRHMDKEYPEIYDIGMSVDNPDVIYSVTTGGGPGPLTGDYPSSFGGVYKSIDGGKTWERKNSGIEKNGGRVTAVYVNPKNEDHAVIGISGGVTSYYYKDIQQGQFFPGGIYVTNDGGESWEKINIDENDVNNEYIQIRSDKSSPSSLYVFGLNLNDNNKNLGFYKSIDGGYTWQSFAPELRNLHITYFDVSNDGKVLYAVSDTGDERLIFKSVDAGQSWSSYQLRSSGYTVTISPEDPNVVLFGKADGLYLSTDGLQTEMRVLQTANGKRLADVQFAPSDPDKVYAVTVGYDLYRSVDNGKTFTKVINIRDEVLNH